MLRSRLVIGADGRNSICRTAGRDRCAQASARSIRADAEHRPYPPAQRRLDRISHRERPVRVRALAGRPVKRRLGDTASMKRRGFRRCPTTSWRSEVERQSHSHLGRVRVGARAACLPARLRAGAADRRAPHRAGRRSRACAAADRRAGSQSRPARRGRNRRDREGCAAARTRSRRRRRAFRLSAPTATRRLQPLASWSISPTARCCRICCRCNSRAASACRRCTRSARCAASSCARRSRRARFT